MNPVAPYEKASGVKPDRDPNTTADAPELVKTKPGLSVPTPTAKPTPGVSEYQPSYKEHDNNAPIYNPKGENNV